tara:strand:- start:162 stop:347 length:186 start_codon:yes stop_codon:yes gene_type:complete
MYWFVRNQTFQHDGNKSRNNRHIQRIQLHHHYQVNATTIDDPLKKRKFYKKKEKEENMSCQ